MITNTCLTGGSLPAEAPGPGAEEPPSECGDPPSEPVELEEVEFDREGVALEWDDRVEDAGAAPAAGLGVGVDSTTDGGSPDGSLDDRPGPDGWVGATVSARGRTTRRGARAEAANVSRLRDPAAPPSITPKPRNTSTSRADTLGGGGVRPSANAEALGAPDVPGPAQPCGPAEAAPGGRQRTRGRSSTS
jgi:hypothetical protein